MAWKRKRKILSPLIVWDDWFYLCRLPTTGDWNSKSHSIAPKYNYFIQQSRHKRIAPICLSVSRDWPRSHNSAPDYWFSWLLESWVCITEGALYARRDTTSCAPLFKPAAQVKAGGHLDLFSLCPHVAFVSLFGTRKFIQGSREAPWLKGSRTTSAKRIAICSSVCSFNPEVH